MPTIKKMKFIEKRNKPYVVLTADEVINGWRCRKSWGADRIKHFSEDWMSIIIPVSIMDDFQRINKDNMLIFDSFKCEVDKSSIPQYYVYNDGCRDHFAVKLTKAFIDSFNERGSRLLRFEPNIDDSVNGLGMKMPEFYSVIIDRDYSGDKIEDMTKEEANIILKNINSNYLLYSSIKKYLSAIALTKTTLEMVEKQVEDFEAEISAEIEKHRDALTAYSATLEDREFDCGFTLIYTKNNFFNENVNHLVSLGKRSDNQLLNVSFPSDYFTCSKSNLILGKLMELSDNPKIKELWVRTILD